MNMPVAEKEMPSQASPKKVKQAYKGAEGTKTPSWELVGNYLPLVKSIVARMRIYFPTQVETQDIYSVALTGLISAAQNYDATRGTSFGSYASLRVRGALLDELRRMDWMPRNDRSAARRYRRAVEELEQKFKRPVTDEEVRVALDITPKAQERLKILNKPLIYIPLDLTPTGEDSDAPSLHEAISDVTELNGREITENRELLKLIKERLGELPKMPQKVLALYYLEGLRLSEIAAVFGVTESRICQIHTQAITLLKNSIQRKMRQG